MREAGRSSYLDQQEVSIQLDIPAQGGQDFGTIIAVNK